MRYSASVVLMLLALGVVSCSKPAATPAAPAPAPAADVKKVLEETCTQCHKLTRIQEYKGSEDWAAIVDRMINVNGAKVTPEQVPQFVAYLEKTFPKK